jgi:hypothetical protein
VAGTIKRLARRRNLDMAVPAWDGPGGGAVGVAGSIRIDHS